MSTQKHTPGPWTDIDGKVSGRVVIAANQPKIRRNVAAVGGPNREANARLIAAAPELLAALKELCADKYLADPINANRMKNARSAIAKAEGEE